MSNDHSVIQTIKDMVKFVMCRWMIDIAGVNPEVAIEAFNEARGHEFDRDNYLADLRMRAAADD